MTSRRNRKALVAENRNRGGVSCKALGGGISARWRKLRASQALIEASARKSLPAIEPNLLDNSYVVKMKLNARALCSEIKAPINVLVTMTRSDLPTIRVAACSSNNGTLWQKQLKLRGGQP